MPLPVETMRTLLSLLIHWVYKSLFKYLPILYCIFTLLFASFLQRHSKPNSLLLLFKLTASNPVLLLKECDILRNKVS